LLQNVLEGTQKAVESFARCENLLTRITNLTEVRFQNIDELLYATKRSIILEHERIVSMRDRLNGISKIMGPLITVCRPRSYARPIRGKSVSWYFGGWIDAPGLRHLMSKSDSI